MTVAYLLDTNTVSLALKGRAPAAVARLAVTPRERVGVSIVTAMELRYGLARSPEATRARSLVDHFLEVVETLTLPLTIVSSYAEVRSDLERRGTPIGALDTIIAAHALALGATLVTNNLREFRRVRGLECEDWTTAR